MFFQNLPHVRNLPSVFCSDAGENLWQGTDQFTKHDIIKIENQIHCLHQKDHSHVTVDAFVLWHDSLLILTA